MHKRRNVKIIDNYCSMLDYNYTKIWSHVVDLLLLSCDVMITVLSSLYAFN